MRPAARDHRWHGGGGVHDQQPMATGGMAGAGCETIVRGAYLRNTCTCSSSWSAELEHDYCCSPIGPASRRWVGRARVLLLPFPRRGEACGWCVCGGGVERFLVLVSQLPVTLCVPHATPKRAGPDSGRVVVRV